MMKRMIASVAAVALVLAFSLWWHSYVHRVVGDMNQHIDASLQAFDRGDKQAGLEHALEARRLWDEAENVLALFISHNITNSIDLNFERVHAYIAEGETVMYVTEMKAIRHSLIDLQESMEVTMRNIL